MEILTVRPAAKVHMARASTMTRSSRASISTHFWVALPPPTRRHRWLRRFPRARGFPNSFRLVVEVSLTGVCLVKMEVDEAAYRSCTRSLVRRGP